MSKSCNRIDPIDKLFDSIKKQEIQKEKESVKEEERKKIYQNFLKINFEYNNSEDALLSAIRDNNKKNIEGIVAAYDMLKLP